MNIQSYEKLIVIDIYLNNEAPQQKRFQATHRLSDNETEEFFERTFDDILQTILERYKVVEFDILIQDMESIKNCHGADSKSLHVNAWKLILKIRKDS